MRARVGFPGATLPSRRAPWRLVRGIHELLGDIVHLNAAKTPDRVALIDATTDRSVTFGELDERVDRLANALLGVGQPGDRVGILAENLPEYVECYYGAPSAGMALTLLNYRLNPKEWAWVLDNAEARVLIVQEKFLEPVRSVLDQVPSVEHVIVIGGSGEGGLASYDDFVGAGSATPPDLEVDEDTTAWLLYTSGTTGFPKGAMLTHRSLVTAAIESTIEYAPQPDERALMAFPLCHVAGYAVSVNLIRGGLIVLMPAFEPELWM